MFDCRTNRKTLDRMMSLNNFSFDLLRLIRRRELMLHVDFITVKIYQDLERVQRQKTPAI